MGTMEVVREAYLRLSGAPLVYECGRLFYRYAVECVDGHLQATTLNQWGRAKDYGQGEWLTYVRIDNVTRVFDGWQDVEQILDSLECEAMGWEYEHYIDTNVLLETLEVETLFEGV